MNPIYPPSAAMPTMTNEHEQRVQAIRDTWAEDRQRALSELEYARRTVKALSQLVDSYDAALNAFASSEGLAIGKGLRV